ncbi:MAG: Flp pilus assembly protein ATPase CpaE [Sphingomonas bacterium]|nr:pilus assembly protein CpaE [Sphingomonas bacterium]MDB5690320.1 Flp pilus assembly protein ATPase CpaE [Sphingomonas bacterium]
MNAPFNPRAAALRDPFTAYVCDDATSDLLKSIASEFGWPHEKINRGGLRNAVQSLSISASPHILFVDLSESGDPLADINGLAEVCEPGTVVIAAGQVNDVRLYRDLVGSGIQDYLLKPFTADQVRDAIAQAQLTIAGPRLSEPTSARPHLACAFIGARGGIGASSLATSVAWLFGDKAGRNTALLDLDVHFGTGALSLDLEPGRGLTDAIENPSRIDGLFIERAMVRANDRLAVLSAEAPINQPLLNDGTAFFQLQEEMRGAFDCTVIDLPRNMLVQHPHLLHDVQAAVVVTEFTLAATRDTIRILSWLKTNAPQCRVLVVANKVPAGDYEIGRKDFESSIERKIDLVIPLDAKLAAQSAKLGKPLAAVGKTTKVGPLLIELANKLIATVDAVAGDDARSGSLLGRIGNLKSMLPARKLTKKS